MVGTAEPPAVPTKAHAGACAGGDREMIEFEQDEELHAKIKVVGVGGGGGNAVNTMIKANLGGVDFVVANSITDPDSGFAVDTNAATLVARDGVTTLPMMSKEALAGEILDRVVALDLL